MVTIPITIERTTDRNPEGKSKKRKGKTSKWREDRGKKGKTKKK
jgi:hypothetical protein